MQTPGRDQGEDTSSEDSGYPVLRSIGFGICALVFGIPGLLFVAGITWGAILVPVAGLILLSPFILAHYFLWSPG